MWLSNMETGFACGSREGVMGAGERMIRQKKKALMYMSVISSKVGSGL